MSALLFLNFLRQFCCVSLERARLCAWLLFNRDVSIQHIPKIFSVRLLETLYADRKINDAYNCPYKRERQQLIPLSYYSFVPLNMFFDPDAAFLPIPNSGSLLLAIWIPMYSARPGTQSHLLHSDSW